jgi:hypothetical protein
MEITTKSMKSLKIVDHIHKPQLLRSNGGSTTVDSKLAGIDMRLKRAVIVFELLKVRG